MSFADTNQTRTRFFKDTLIYATANYMSQFLGFFNSIFLRKFLGPASMGVWGLMQVILDYCGQASLGTTRAMARDYPFYKAKGELQKADDIRDTTLSFTMLMSWLPFFAILGYIFFKGKTLDPAYLYCLYFLLGFLFLQRFYDFIIMLLRSDRKFKTLSLIIFFNSVFGLVATLTAVRFWGLQGLVWSTALTMALLIGIAWKAEAFKFRFLIYSKELTNELRAGLPLALGAFLIIALRGLDKMIIAKELGFYEVGIYSIAMMVANYILSVPMMLSHVWYPNLQAAYGKNDGNLESVKHYLEKPLLGLAALLPILCAFSFLLIPIIIHYQLKDFSAGIPVMRLYLLGLFFTMLGQFSLSFLITAGKYWSMIPVIGIAMFVNYFGNRWLLGHGWGLEGVSVCTVGSFAIYGIGCMMLALKQVMKTKERALLMIRSVGVYLALYLFVLIIDQHIFYGHFWKNMGVKAVLYIILFLPVMAWIEKELHVFSEIGKIISGFGKRGEAKHA